MGHGLDISSEQELLQLREEGKISKDEYNELLGVLNKPVPRGADTVNCDFGNVGQKRKSGRIAFCLMLAGILLPALVFLVGLAISSLGGLGEMDVVFSWCLVLCVVLEIPAFVVGVIAWPDAYGKATVTTLALIAALGGLSTYLSYRSTIESQRARRDLAVAELQGMRMREAQRQQEQTPRKSPAIEKLKLFPLDDVMGLITRSGVTIDKSVSSDGKGSLRIDVTEPTTVRLFETGDIDAENARLIYQANVRAEKLEGRAYLEMLCRFPGKGEFFSKGLMNPITGTTDWTAMETPFLLKSGENPDNVKLNIVVEGTGRVWIDDVRLLKGPLI